MEIQAYKPSDAGNLSTWAADINAAHADAVKHAISAIEYAKTAGELLLKVKQKLPHGQFGTWLEANCSVSERQAQRYMAAAQGKPLPIRHIKSDTVSYLGLTEYDAAAEKAESDTMRLLLESDAPLADVTEKYKQALLQIPMLDARIVGLQNENMVLVRTVKSVQSKLKRLEQTTQ